jgi:hypothetical protein
MVKSGATREESGVANMQKSIRVEETHPKVLTSIGMGGAHPYRPPVPPGTAFA